MSEALSAVAVVLTLGYLAIQVRQNTRATKAAGLAAISDVHVLTDRNERYIAYLMKAQRGEALTPEERAHMVEHFLMIMRQMESIWLRHRIGALSREQRDQHLDLLRWAMSTPLARRMWTHLQPTFDPAFRAVVQSQALADDAPTGSMSKAFFALAPEEPNPR